MADYSVDIKLAIAGAKELDRVNRATEKLTKKIKEVNKVAGLSGKRPVKSFNNLSKSVRDANKALDEAAIGTKQFSQAIKNVVQVEDLYNRQLRIKNQALKAERLSMTEGISLKQANIKIIQQEIEAENRLAESKRRSATAEKSRRRNRIIQSVGIGGGFPLLFGGGPVQALAGGLGGGIGEALSPGGGFAGSIAATALSSSIQQFSDSARDVGNALKDANLGLQSLEDLGFKVDESTKKQVESLLELGKVREAEILVNQKFAEIVGPQAVKNLQNLDTAYDELQKASSRLFLTLASELAPAIVTIIGLFEKVINTLTGPAIQRSAANLDPQGFQEAMSKAASESSRFGIVGDKQLYEKLLTQYSQDIIKKSTIDLSTGMTDLGGGKGSSNKKSDFNKFELNILDQRIGLQKINNDFLDKEFVLKKRGLIEAETALDIARAEGNENKIAIANKNRILKLNDLDLAITKAKLKDEKDLTKFLEDQRKKLEDLEDKQKKIAEREIERVNKLKESANSVTKNLEQQHELNLIKLSGSEYELALANATLGLSKEQLALFDEEAFKIAFNNKLRSDGLLEQKQITQEIKTLLATEMSSAIKGLITGTHNLNSALSSVLNKMAEAMLNMGLFGNVGGSLTSGGGLLGTIFGGLLHEGGPARRGNSYIVGEKGPEMFTPGVSGMVTPNNALGGSNNIVVNVDASGTEAQGDDTTSSQLGKVIGLAVQAELVKQSRAGGLLSRA